MMSLVSADYGDFNNDCEDIVMNDVFLTQKGEEENQNEDTLLQSGSIFPDGTQTVEGDTETEKPKKQNKDIYLSIVWSSTDSFSMTFT